MCASVTKQYNLVPAKKLTSLAGKVTAGLVESNNILPQVYDWVTCRQTAKKPDQLRARIIEYRTALLYLLLDKPTAYGILLNYGVRDIKSKPHFSSSDDINNIKYISNIHDVLMKSSM